MQLEYDEAYQTACSLRLNSGRMIRLFDLSQSMTYNGLLEGYPTSRENNRTLAHLTDREKQLDRWAPVLVEPQRRAAFHVSANAPDKVFGGRVPEWLPMITCVGRFKSMPTGLDKDAHISTLTIIWFQDNYALPIADEALLAIKALNWVAAAQDVRL